jgi:hypothetical protein
VPRNTEVREAEALERDAEDYPEERGEILLAAAAAWRRAGEPRRAREILEALVEEGGEDAGYARIELAGSAFENGDSEAATAWLDALVKDPDLHEGHCQLAGELLAEHGDLSGALRWYDRYVSRLTDHQLAALEGEHGWLRDAAIVLGTRREIREKLGFAPDSTDELVPSRPADPMGEIDRLLAGIAPGGSAHRARVRLLVFPRAERTEAARRWPDLYDDDPGYFLEVERQRRADAEAGAGSAILVPASVAELVAFAEREGGSPTEETTRLRYLATVPQERHISWPPARNDRCWCGSQIKYKRCCGRPNI